MLGEKYISIDVLKNRQLLIQQPLVCPIFLIELSDKVVKFGSDVSCIVKFVIDKIEHDISEGDSKVC